MNKLILALGLYIVGCRLNGFAGESRPSGASVAVKPDDGEDTAFGAAVASVFSRKVEWRLTRENVRQMNGMSGLERFFVTNFSSRSFWRSIPPDYEMEFNGVSSPPWGDLGA